MYICSLRVGRVFWGTRNALIRDLLAKTACCLRLFPFMSRSISCPISKTRASVSSGYPNTDKQMKARGRRPSAFIVSRCLDTPMKHEARVLEITSHACSTDHA